MSEPTQTFTGPELCRFEAHEIIALLRKGEVTPQELLDATYTRIAAVNPVINAFPTLCEDRAYEAIGDLDQSLCDHPGWMGGLPIGIKDLTEVAGVRTTHGTQGLRDFVPEESYPLVSVLEQRGGVVVGKTNTPELGAGGNTYNAVFGATLNPWNTDLNAGGSSGGAAASLATGATWLSHGSDHGGSLRTPAAYCGIVGMRPSPGIAGGASLNTGFMIEGTQGPMARSVRDCALFLDAMAGYDPRYPISFPAPDRPYQQAVDRPDNNIRIAFSPVLGGMAQADPEMLSHLGSVMQLLAQNGAIVDAADPDIPNLERTYHILRGILWATVNRRMPRSVSQHYKDTLAENTAFGEALTMGDVADAQLDRSILYNNMLTFFDDWDVLACPVVGCMPHPQEEEWVRNVGGESLSGYMDWLRYAFLATTCGLPAISVPVGLGPGGLPVGVQLIGKPRGEADLLAAARFVEMSVGGPLLPIDPRS